LLGDFLKTGRAGHVDFSQVLANDIEPHQQQAALLQHRPQTLGDLQVTRTQRLCHPQAAHCQIATYFFALRDARQTIRYCFTIDQQNPLVPRGNGGDEFLHHQGAGTVLIQGFNNATQIHAVNRDPEDAQATHSVERFQDDVFVFVMKSMDIDGTACHQGWCNELWKLENSQFFRVVTQCLGSIEHPRTFTLGLPKQVCGIKIFTVKWRVFAHHNGVKVLQRHVHVAINFKPLSRTSSESDYVDQGVYRVAQAPSQLRGSANGKGVAPLLRSTHHGKTAVLMDFERG